MVFRRLGCVLLGSLIVALVVASPVQSLPLGDLRIDSVEIVQVVKNPKALVMNKSTVLYVMIHSTFPSRVQADISIAYDFGLKHYLESGPEGTGVPLDPGDNFVYLPGGNCSARSGWWLTLPAWFMWSMPGVDVAIRVVVDPYDELDETNEGNNEGRPDGQQVDVVRAEPLKVLFGEAIFNGDVPFYHEGLSMMYLTDTYPLEDGGVTWSKFRAASYATSDLKDAADRVAISKTSDALALGYDRLVIVYHDEVLRGRATGILMVPENRVPVTVTDFGIMTMTDLVAHELGHTYYLWHPHDIGLGVYESTCYWPWAKDYGRLGSTFMSYTWILPEDLPIHPRWVDEGRYQSYPKTWIPTTSTSGAAWTWQWNLFDQFTIPLTKVEALIIVTGEVSRDGDVTLSPMLYRIANSVPDLIPLAGAPGPGNYTIRLRDDMGTILSDLPFNVTHSYSVHDDDAGTSETVYPDSTPFVFKVEIPPETHSIEIVNVSTGAVAASRVASSAAPSVNIDYPNGGEHIQLGSECVVRWTASDPDSADLRYMVAYSSDGGEMWVPIASNITESSCVWNTSGIDPGNDYLVKVMALDGFNMGEDVSNSTVAVVDSVPPTTTVHLTGTTGTDGWYVSSVGVTFSVQDNHIVNRTECRMDEGPWAIWSGSFNITVEGAHRVCYRSVDESGNCELEKSVDLKIDWTAPSVSISSPGNDSEVKTEDVDVSWIGLDAVSGIQTYYVRADDGDWISAGTNSRHTFADMGNGEHTVELRAVDGAGNENSTSVLFTVDVGSAVDWILVALVAISAGVSGLAVYLVMRAKKI
jgi:hypothetical protein